MNVADGRNNSGASDPVHWEAARFPSRANPKVSSWPSGSYNDSDARDISSWMVEPGGGPAGPFVSARTVPV